MSWFCLCIWSRGREGEGGQTRDAYDTAAGVLPVRVQPAGWLTQSLLTAAAHHDALTAQLGLCRIQLNSCFCQFT